VKKILNKEPPMKNSLLLFLFLTFLPFLVFSQNTGLQSAFNLSCSDVFGNELDAALTVDETGYKPGFSELLHRYIFAGITNLELVVADDTFVATTTDPLWVGYYSPGSLSWSIFTGFYFDNATGNQASNTTNTNNAVPVGTTTHYWVAHSVDTNYTKNRITDRLNTECQFLIGLGGINTGLYLLMDLVDNSNQANNYTETETNYYNSAAPGVEPVQNQDYEITRTETDLDTMRIFGVAVPFFMRTGSLAHTANLRVDITSTDTSSSFTRSYSDSPESNLGTVTEIIEDDTTSGASDIDIELDYTLTMAPFIKNHAENEFFVGITGGLVFENAEYSYISTDQDINFPGGGSAGTNQTGDDDSTIATIQRATDMSVGLDVGHSLYFDIAPQLFLGMTPTLGINFTRDNPILVTRVVDINRTDGDDNGAFTSAADTITTTTIDYYNASAVNYITGLPSAGSTASTYITSWIEFPIALHGKLGNLPFFIAIGSTPRIQNQITLSSSNTATYSYTVDTNDGTGADIAETTVNEFTGNPSSSLASTFTISAVHNIGIYMIFGEAVRLDVYLNLSSGINILDFQDLALQLIIKLP